MEILGKTVLCSVCLTNKERARARPIVLGILGPARLSVLGRPRLHVGDGSSVAGSQVTQRKPEPPQASEEILPDKRIGGDSFPPQTSEDSRWFWRLLRIPLLPVND